MAAGAICFSAKAIFIKTAYINYGVDALTLLCLRFGFSLPFFLAIGLYRAKTGKLNEMKKKDWFYTAILSFLGYYIASLYDFKGLEYISAGLERVILFTYPTLVIIFSRVFLKKEITRNGIISLAITYIGIILIAFDSNILNSSDFTLGATYIFISAITYALFLVFGGEMINKYGSVNFNTISMSLSSIYVLIHFYYVSEVDILTLQPMVYVFGIILALVSTVIPTFMVAEGIKILGASNGSIVASIGPVSTIVLAYVFLGEILSGVEFVGSILVIIGVLVIGKK